MKGNRINGKGFFCLNKHVHVDLYQIYYEETLSTLECLQFDNKVRNNISIIIIITETLVDADPLLYEVKPLKTEY